MISKAITKYSPINIKIFLLSNNFKTFCDKSEIKYFKPKYYGDINKISPPEHYNESYKLKFG